ncbi:MAG: RNA pseudouridine synthase [Verrucomicrobiaceae bacterium]|nr:RNA pseudouridine synthase [Verrucomicrobiaceae bacterium]
MTAAIANNPRFTVLDETADFIVVDKPAPLQIHPKKPGGPPTLYDGLRELLAFEMANGGQVSIINRLDRETSGVVLVAKNAATARRFGLAMQARSFQKTYAALVHGWPEWDEYTCRAPILRKGEVAPSAIWVQQMVHPAGAECCTEFRVTGRHTRSGRRIALLTARPVTGRMHQIRVHLAHLGHAVLGDKIYGADERCYLDFIETGWTPDLESRLLMPRHALHSRELGVRIDAKAYRWTAPFPVDMRTWLEPHPPHEP